MTDYPQDETLKELVADYGNTPQLKAINVTELRQYKFKSKEMILAPWLPTQSAAMMHAIRGIGKTHVSLGIAYAVASGGKFLSWDADKPRGVLFIDGEMPGHALQERIEKIAANASNAVTASLIFITPDLQEYGMPDLATFEGQQAIEQHINDSIELVIIDNLSSLVRSGRENEAESWQPIQDWVLRLRAKGKSVLLIHHSNKSGSQRGTSRREDILDTVICLRRASDYTPEKGAFFEMHFEKSRYLFGDEVLPFTAQLVTDDNNLQRWVISTLEESNFDKVAVLSKDGLKPKDICEELCLNKSTVSRYLKRARERGLLTKD